MNQSEKQWYALQVKPHQEMRVTDLLKEIGQEAFLPLATSGRSCRLPSIRKEGALFPGYTFCRMDWHNSPKLYQIGGFIRVVGAGKIPIPLGEEEMSAIRCVLDHAMIAEPCKSYFLPGEIVDVIDGPFAGQEVEVQSSKQTRVIVSMPLLHRSIRVCLQAAWLCPSQRVTRVIATPQELIRLAC